MGRAHDKAAVAADAGRAPTGRRLPPALRRALLFLRDAAIIAAVTVLLLEVSLRAYAYVSPSFIFGSTDANRQFRAKPFSYDYDFRINSRGFKDVEFATEKPPGTVRVVALGDSFTYGAVPYAANYVTLLKEALRERFGNVEVLNMGIPGTGPRDYLELLGGEAAALDPDVVIVSLFLGNDFEPPRRVRSYLYELARFAVRLGTQTTGQIYHGPGTYDDDAPVFTDERYLALERERSAVFRRDPGAAEPAIRAGMEHVAAMKRVADQRGIRLYAVLIPDEVQVDAALQEKVVRSAGHAPSDYDFGGLNRRIARFLDELGVEHLDLLPAFLARSETRLYRVNDSHWNIAGNALAAEAILRDMLARPGMFAPARSAPR